MTAATTGRNSRFAVAGVLAATAVVAVLALFELGRKSLWSDEAFSVRVGTNWDAFVGALSGTDVNMVLYYVLLRGWLTLGTDEATVRLLSALFAVCTVPVVYWLGRDLFSVRVGLAAALLIALNAFVIEYAQEARSYTLVMFLAATSTLLLVRALRAQSWRWWIVYGLVAALLPFAHIVAASVWVVHGFAALTHVPRPRWRFLGAPIVISVLAAAPLAWVVVTADRSGLSWIPGTTIEAVAHSLVALAGAGLPPGDLRIPGIALTVCILALAVFGAVATWRSSRHERWGLMLLIGWLIIPFAIVIAISIRQPLLVVRYLMFVVPALSLLAALGLRAIRVPVIRPVVLGVVVALALMGLNNWYRSYPKPDWAGASYYLLARANSEDRAVFLGDWGFPLRYYAAQAGAEDRLPAQLVPELSYGDVSFPSELLQAALETGRENRDVWVLSAGGRPDPDADPLLAPFRAVYRASGGAAFELVTVSRFEPQVTSALSGTIRAPIQTSARREATP